MESLLVMFLMGVILAGIAAVQGTIMRNRGRTFRELTVQTQAQRSFLEIQRAVSTSHSVARPTAGAFDNDLRIYRNYDPRLPSPSKIVPSVDMEFFRFCLTPGGALYRYYRKAPTVTVTTVPCGQSPGANVQWEPLAGVESGPLQVRPRDYAAGNIFFRYPEGGGTSNQVGINYEVVFASTPAMEPMRAPVASTTTLGLAANF